MAKTIRLNGKDIPCQDVLKIRTVMVSDELHTEFTYREFNPYHETVVLLPREKGYPLELKVRKSKGNG